MNIKQITQEPIPVELEEEAARAIRLLFTKTGMAILSTMTDASVIDLWQYGLREVEQLSAYNEERGLAPIQYPHIWLKKYLFSHVYKNWLTSEETAKELLSSLEPLITKRHLRVVPNPVKPSYSMPPLRKVNHE